jgi:hypothetical protein
VPANDRGELGAAARLQRLSETRVAPELGLSRLGAVEALGVCRDSGAQTGFESCVDAARREPLQPIERDGAGKQREKRNTEGELQSQGGHGRCAKGDSSCPDVRV